MNCKRIQFFFINLSALIILGWGTVCAQIAAPTSDWQGITQYSNVTQQDTIYVFYPDNPVLLSATLPDSLLPATFFWYRYNPDIRPDTLDRRFEPFDTVPNDSISVLSNLLPGGYRVIIVPDSLPDTSFVFNTWTMVDDVEITGIEYQNTCAELYLYITSEPSPLTILYEVFKYYDISRANHAIINLGSQYERNIKWTASNSEIEIPTYSSFDITVLPPPLFDASYTATVQSPFGRTQQVSTEAIAAIATLAGFDIFIKDHNDAFSKADDDANGEALLELRLESTSKNADSIFWKILNDTYYVEKGADSILWSDSATFSSPQVEPPKDFMVPGSYEIELIALKWTNGILCVDTLIKPVRVDTSFIKPEGIPNVFTPNSSDNQNSVFNFIRAEDGGYNEWVMSIKDFRIIIFNRWGRKVYEYSGDIREWAGWDGTIREQERVEASDGVYYYIIEGTGWDGKRFRGGSYKGFVYLFRGRD